VASTIPGRSRQAPKSRRTGDWPTSLRASISIAL
jgi:hypothetical protein